MANEPEIIDLTGGSPPRIPGSVGPSLLGGVRPTPSNVEIVDLTEESASLGQAVGAFARGVTGEVSKAVPTIAATGAGMRLGALAPPPFTLPAIALGGATGFFSGQGTGELAAQELEALGLAVADPDALPSNERGFAAAGQTFGGSMVFAAAPLAAARLGITLPPSFAGDFLNSVIRSAASAPGRFTAVETVGAAAAGVAGGVAEATEPDSPWLRALAEIGAGTIGTRFATMPGRLFQAPPPVDFDPKAGITQGLLTAFRFARSLPTRVVSTVTDFAKSFTQAGRMEGAAGHLSKAVERVGEDPDALIDLLKTVDVTGVGGPPLDAAQLTGSRAFAEFQADLKTINQKYSADVARQTEDALDATNRAIYLLRGTGDPAALRAAAVLRRDQFRTMLNVQAQLATHEAELAARQITADTPKTRRELSLKVEKILDGVMTRAQTVSHQLWDEVPSHALPADGTDTLLASYSRLRGEMPERVSLGAFVEGTVKDYQHSRQVLQDAARGAVVESDDLARAHERFTTKKLIEVRKELLEQARVAQRESRWDDARRLGILSEAIIDDLSRANVAGPGTAYDNARQFSREFHDVFTRSFVGKVEAVGQYGDRIPPQLLLRRALATGEELGALQMQEIENATRFLMDRGRGTPIDAESFQTLLDAQERVLRLAATQAVERDDITGAIKNISPSRMRAFMDKHVELLDRFPEAKHVLEEAVTTETGRRMTAARIQRASTFAEQRAVIAHILDVESVADAVQGALGSKNPIGQLGAMARLATNAGPDAVMGLRAAVIEDAFRRAAVKGQRYDPEMLVSALDDPIRPGAPSRIRLMRQQGLITAEEHDLLDTMTERIRKILTAGGARTSGEPPVAETDAIIDTLVRGAGSMTAVTGMKALPGGGATGPQLILAKRGSEASRNIFEKLPGLKVQTLMQNAMRGDPLSPGAPRFSLLRALMEPIATAARHEELIRQIHAYTIHAGVAAGDYQLEGEPK